jgi:hypothetical protein
LFAYRKPNFKLLIGRWYGVCRVALMWIGVF